MVKLFTIYVLVAILNGHPLFAAAEDKPDKSHSRHVSKKDSTSVVGPSTTIITRSIISSFPQYIFANNGYIFLHVGRGLYREKTYKLMVFIPKPMF